MAEYEQGFTTLNQEIVLNTLPIQGTIPAWLSGTLIRNGPGKFEVNNRPYNHWFDGLAMLHRFTVHQGCVSYANRYLKSQDYTASISTGSVNMRAFATDPCMSVFRRVMSVFDTNMTDNSNINVVNWADRFIALTESPFAVEFDPITLETTAHHDFSDHILSRAATTAHPHTDPRTGQILNFAVRFDFPRSAYRIYTYHPNTNTRTLIGEIPVTRPAYIHSFGITEHYAVIAEYPLTVNVPDLAFSGKAFIENYRWHPNHPTRFHLIHRNTGKLAHTFEVDAFFAFHHINAYEEENSVIVDIVAYDDTRAIDGLYLDAVRVGDPDIIPSGEARRYTLDTRRQSASVSLLSKTLIELPRINDAYNTRPYRYVYGISGDPGTHVGFPNQLAKISVESDTATIWRETGCYPGEPVFVPAPNATHEDDGVILSVVLDINTNQSFLLILNAATMTELARATVPHHIPFGFHGSFYSGLGTGQSD